MSQLGEVGEIGDLSTGELLDGRYRLEERIGEGGAGRVYRAEDTLLGRTVAVKVLRGPLDGLGSPERAQSETALLASLNHHGLVTLFDARVSNEESSYLVMEYVEGITLRDRIVRGSIDSAEAASLAVDIAEALHVAHLAGIVHRDIKPSNILLWESPVPGQGWRAKIADFGIAYLLDSGRLTTPGLLIGTAAYVAPEQARGAMPAPPADIYALGLVLIEALTGRRPFADAEGIGVVMARLQRSPDIPEALEQPWQQLLRGMTAMRPGDRPTALEVAMAAARLSGAGAFAAPGVIGAESTVAWDPAVEIMPTAILPLEAAATETVAAAAAPVRPVESPRRVERASRRRRRRWAPFAAISLSLLLVAAVVGAAIWTASSAQGTPEPSASRTAEEVVNAPTVVPTPSGPGVAPAGPSVAPADKTGASGGSGGATVNPRSGPGNNNGGNGKGKGKGGKG